MGDPGEPGSPSREITRAALLAGLGIASCTCKTKNDSALEHEPSCEIAQARVRGAEILEGWDKERRSCPRK